MKNYLFGGMLCLLAISFTPELRAQIHQGGRPKSFQLKTDLSTVPVLNPGTVDLEKLRAEDAQRRQMGKEFDRRFGHNFYVEWGLANSGRWLDLPNGDRLWQLRVSCPGALSINITFSSYKLPEGADLFIAGKKNYLGAFTAFNNQPDEKLGTGILGGDEILVEYYEPNAVKGMGKLVIGRVTYGYRNPFSTLGWGDSQFCEVNVNCPEGQPWQKEKRAVARIIDGGDLCTGALVNNTAMDGKPYFLTANHCFNNDVTTWVFSFNWEAPACSTPVSQIPETETISGCTLRARNAFSDFCLLELSSKPPASFNAYYAGWSAEDVPSLNSTMIHHPAGDIKKITFDYNPSVSSGYGVGSANDNSHWQTVNYELSTTEGGSSGCPQFDQNHRIIGQLHGGPASCTNISSDFYGKFSQSWATGATPATRLREWLDPLNNGVVQLDGFDPACLKMDVNLPWSKNLDTVSNPLPHLWKVKNPDADSGFALVSGGYGNLSGKAFLIVADQSTQPGRGDSLLLAPLGVSRYKNLKISFRHAYRRKNSIDTDTLNLLVSRDCGSSFKLLARISGSALSTTPETGNQTPFFPADTSLWNNNLILLDSTYNRPDQLVIGFAFRSANAGTLWLDEIGLSGDTAKNKPLARFESNSTGGCAGVSIQFADSSLFGANRTWFFEGGSPASSTEPNPLVTYSEPGTFSVRLVVSNEEGSDTLDKVSYVLIQDIGLADVPFLQDYEASTGSFPGIGYVLINPENNITWSRNATVNAPGSAGGSLMFDNWSNPDVTGETDLLVFPKILTAGKQHLKVRFKYAYKFYQGFFGGVSPDTLTIGRGADCGSSFNAFWKKGGQELATAGSTTSSYTPAAGDWKTISLNLDSLLIYPEVSLGFQNTFGYGNRLFIDDIVIDTVDNCPQAPQAVANDDTLCTGKILVLTMDSVLNATYNWSGPGNFNSGSRISTRTVNLQAAGTYNASVTVNGCTSEQSSVTVAVITQPGVPVITQNGNVLSGPPGFSYIWLLNGDTLPDQTQAITVQVSGTYVLIVRNNGGCFRSSLPKIVSITGIQEIISGEFRIYPNPASDYLNLSWEEKNPASISLLNALGQIIRTEFPDNEAGNFRISTAGLAPGMYWLLLSATKELHKIPFSKQ